MYINCIIDHDDAAHYYYKYYITGVPTETGHDFVMQIQCSSRNVDIKWEVNSDTYEYHAVAHLECKNRSGKKVWL